MTTETRTSEEILASNLVRLHDFHDEALDSGNYLPCAVFIAESRQFDFADIAELIRSLTSQRDELLEIAKRSSRACDMGPGAIEDLANAAKATIAKATP
jgi:hypothetical protein